MSRAVITPSLHCLDVKRTAPRNSCIQVGGRAVCLGTLVGHHRGVRVEALFDKGSADRQGPNRFQTDAQLATLAPRQRKPRRRLVEQVVSVGGGETPQGRAWTGKEAESASRTSSEGVDRVVSDDELAGELAVAEYERSTGSRAVGVGGAILDQALRRKQYLTGSMQTNESKEAVREKLMEIAQAGPMKRSWPSVQPNTPASQGGASTLSSPPVTTTNITQPTSQIVPKASTRSPRKLSRSRKSVTLARSSVSAPPTSLGAKSNSRSTPASSPHTTTSKPPTVREVETDAQGGGERRRGRPRKATAVATEYRGTSDPTSSQSRAARWRSKSPSPSPGLQQPPQRSRTIESLINSMKSGEPAKQRLLTAAEEQVYGMHSKELLRIEQMRESIIQERMRQEIADSVTQGVAAVNLNRVPTDAELARALMISPRQLAHRIKEGLRARELLVEGNARLVMWIAKKYQGGLHGLSNEDLIQEGTFGLMKGAEKFDPEKGYRFSTYAYHWVRQGVSHAIQNHGRTIRLPVYLQELKTQINKKTAELEKKGVVATDEVIAKELGIKVSRVHEVSKWSMGTLSLDKVIDGMDDSGDNKDQALSDTISANDSTGTSEQKLTGTVEEDVERDMLKMDLEDLLDTLLPRERYILRMRYGLDNSQFKSLREISDTLGVSEETIRQYELRGIRKLRHPQRAGYLSEYLSKRERVDNGLEVQESTASPDLATALSASSPSPAMHQAFTMEILEDM
eukprot:CAMPEP_0114283542 /NCGR_PEP_ID=MMETSP0059-20121206/4160_1 /TAXON_ID=36894 /ORGANISM="Pyramimonas parkeae, Strain CCMP726" /LENGTH=740 /DNA_ID=CAMNT_0001404283 /DNA_START=80 /DNA_END=2302 /DNA_ORIENTATION=+